MTTDYPFPLGSPNSLVPDRLVSLSSHTLLQGGLYGIIPTNVVRGIFYSVEMTRDGRVRVICFNALLGKSSGLALRTQSQQHCCIKEWD